MNQTSDNSDVSKLSVILNNTHKQMIEISCLASSVDEILGELSCNFVHDQRSREMMQNVDLLRQSVICIEKLVGNLSNLEIASISVRKQSVGEGIFLGKLRSSILDSTG